MGVPSHKGGGVKRYTEEENRNLKKNTVFLWTQKWIKHSQIPHYCLEKATSSNDLAKKKAFQGLSSPVGFLVQKQSQGRGQGLNSWEDSDLMISFLWEKIIPPLKPSSSLDYTKALYQALRKTWSLPNLKIKAPNDLHLDHKKVSGILLEVLSQGSNTALIVGLGLNIFHRPKSIESAYLSEQTQNIEQKTWFLFLDQLFFLWNQKICSEPLLQPYT